MSFKHLKLIEPLERALAKQGYVEPTPIQEKAIPELLEGRDLIGIAQTGTGKTAAFVLPILQRMTMRIVEKPRRVIRTLVLAPTRELAAQIGESFSAYGQFLKFKHTVIFGGVGQGSQVIALLEGVDIVVATPGRLLDLIGQGELTLENIEFFVLDEADRMLDMGFIDDIRRIIEMLPEKRQSFFFSATMSPKVNELARRLLKNPVHIEVAPQATPVESVKQCIFFVNSFDKERLLLDLVMQKHLTRVLVFTRTKHRADKVAWFLRKNGIIADAIHGNKSQSMRTRTIIDFKSGRIQVLVATDIAARGIDIDDISHVINFELPNEPELYIHRIGRTARAGAAGTAYSFCAADEREYLRDIENLINQKIEVMDHRFHSESAKNAVGFAARPPPRNQRGSRYGRSGYGRGRGGGGRAGGSRSHSRPRDDSRDSSRNFRSGRGHRQQSRRY